MYPAIFFNFAPHQIEISSCISDSMIFPTPPLYHLYFLSILNFFLVNFELISIHFSLLRVNCLMLALLADDLILIEC